MLDPGTVESARRGRLGFRSSASIWGTFCCLSEDDSSFKLSVRSLSGFSLSGESFGYMSSSSGQVHVPLSLELDSMESVFLFLLRSRCLSRHLWAKSSYFDNVFPCMSLLSTAISFFSFDKPIKFSSNSLLSLREPLVTLDAIDMRSDELQSVLLLLSLLIALLLLQSSVDASSMAPCDRMWLSIYSAVVHFLPWATIGVNRFGFMALQKSTISANDEWKE